MPREDAALALFMCSRAGGQPVVLNCNMKGREATGGADFDIAGVSNEDFDTVQVATPGSSVIRET
jgi:hypothetical protein